MTGIEEAIITAVADYHETDRETAKRWVDDVMALGPDSAYFDLVARQAMTVVRPLWNIVQTTIRVWAPLLADITEQEDRS
jgi:hypothetical protein